MKKLVLMTTAVLLAATAKAQTTTPQSQMEKLTRGVVAVPGKSSGMFVSWRYFGTDDENTSFDVLRNGTLVARNILNRTSYADNNGTAANSYQIVTKQKGVAVDTTEAVKGWENIYMQIPLDRPAGGTVGGSDYTYSPNDCSVADVDGDGEYEIIVKWDPSNSKDNSQSGYTGNVYLDCYKLDGTKLWRIDLGVNIRAGAHYTQFLAYDFDGDGKAEIVCKTAAGSTDGTGKYVSRAADDTEILAVDDTKDWRNSSGKVKGGQEWLTVFNGETGAAIHTVFYNPNRNCGLGGEAGWTFNWDSRSGKTDKEYGNRGERYLAAVAYLDGPDSNPSAVMGRGYYTYAYLWAVDFDGSKLKTKWLHGSVSNSKVEVTDANGNKTSKTYSSNTSGRSSGSKTLFGNGNHNLSVADVDGDGCDEIIYGSAAVDHDGQLMYATGYGHGDAMHLSDLIPSHPGLEVFEVHEESNYGWDIHDAATGEILLSSTGGSDNGRGLAADIDGTNDGFEFWSSNDRSIRSAETGDVVQEKSVSVNFRAYWDGDLRDELLDGSTMDKWTGTGTSRIYPISGKNFYNIANSSTCNSTKKTPNLLADILGDWREELILWDSSDNAHLNVFTTNEETEFRVPCLMHDHVYRMGVAWQNVAYNQPPHLGYYLPSIFVTKYGMVQDGEFTQTVNLGDSIQTIERNWQNSSYPSLAMSIAPDGTTAEKKAVDGFTFTLDRIIKKTFTLKGKPLMAGQYQFIITSGANVVDNSTRNDTIRINVVNATGISDIAAETTGNGIFRMSDNTFSDQLTISLAADSGSKASVGIYDAGGKRVFARTYNGAAKTITINGLEGLAQGFYIINVETEKGKQSEKIVKN